MLILILLMRMYPLPAISPDCIYLVAHVAAVIVDLVGYQPIDIGRERPLGTGSEIFICCPARLGRLRVICSPVDPNIGRHATCVRQIASQRSAACENIGGAAVRILI